MHEWALAESIILTAIKESKKNKLKNIDEINIKIGELQQIERDIFNFALNEVLKDYNNKFKNVKINIEITESKLKCNICGNIWNFRDISNNLNSDESEAIHFIPEVSFVHSRCTKCKSPDFKIISGRGISISSIKGSR
jgi:hydrogenase nickel incorporation protein HypA/HybF